MALMHSLRSPSSMASYVVADNDPIQHRGIQELEHQLLFDRPARDDARFVHNDMSLSNIIADCDQIVGIIDWEMAGFFGWKAAADVHVQILMLKRSNFAALNLPEELLDNILYWNDLYSGRPRE
ncbi:MAG: hypothetical protein M1818_006306 [Claussenomyces sp. TS43310]|nr:MAG: hypothetical protein M1818_006306 [Claussenomyces sp. TS43310]